MMVCVAFSMAVKDEDLAANSLDAVLVEFRHEEYSSVHTHTLEHNILNNGSPDYTTCEPLFV
jgi:hypothetical protein